MDTDTITIDVAGEIDAQWTNSGMPDNGLRIYGLRRNGNGSTTFLAVPGDDSAPCYQRVNSHFEHVAGPTLAEWQQAQRFNEIDADNAAHYHSLAAESQDAVNVALFAEKADFYAARAASR